MRIRASRSAAAGRCAASSSGRTRHTAQGLVARRQRQRRRPAQINDHSWVHIQIVANIALKLLRQLTKHGIEPSVVTGLRHAERRRRGRRRPRRAHALRGDVGPPARHEDWSLFLAEPKLRELLDGIYEEPDRTVIVSEVLPAITSHRADGEPLSLEAGILRVARRARHGEGTLPDPVREGPGDDALPLGRRGRGASGSATARRSPCASRS